MCCTIHYVCIWLIIIRGLRVLNHSHAGPHRAAPAAGKSSHGLTFQSLLWRLQLHHVPPRDLAHSAAFKNSLRIDLHIKNIPVYIVYIYIVYRTSYIDQWCSHLKRWPWDKGCYLWLVTITNHHHIWHQVQPTRVACRARWAMAASLWRSETASWKTPSFWWFMRFQFKNPWPNDHES